MIHLKQEEGTGTQFQRQGNQKDEAVNMSLFRAFTQKAGCTSGWVTGWNI